MDDLMTRIAAKKAKLDRLRPAVGAGLGNLEHIHDLELTYTSNAIEGNALSAAETTLVIEQGITIGGKPLKDHLEAIDHYEAIGYVRAGVPRVATDRGRFAAVASSRRAALASRDCRPLRRSGPLRSDRNGAAHLPPAGGSACLMGDLARW